MHHRPRKNERKFSEDFNVPDKVQKNMLGEKRKKVGLLFEER